MKKLILLPLAFMVVALAFFAPVLDRRNANEAEHAQIMARMNAQCVTTLRDNLIATAEPVMMAQSTSANITMSNAPNARQNPHQSDMVERREGGVYTREGRRIFRLRDTTGMLVTEDGDLVTIDDEESDRNPTREGSQALHFNEQTNEFVDGANRSLAVFLDSRLQRNFLRSGGRYTRMITLDTTIHLVNFRGGAVDQTIYVSIRSYRSGWWIFGQTTFRAYDMNGREINNRYIGLPQPPPGWHMVVPILNIVSTINFANAVSAFEIIASSRLDELLENISHATLHPWPTIVCEQTGYDVVTEDGRVIRVNPRTRQLTDFFGFALFNRISGLPIIFFDFDIVTVGSQGVVAQQRIETAVLRDSFTVNELLQTGTPFHMHIIQNAFGSYDVPVLNHGTDANPDFRLLNGESTRGITIEHEINRDTNTGFWEGIRNLFGGGDSGFGFMQIMAIALAVFVFILLLPVFVFVFKAFGFVISLLPSPRKKQTQPTPQTRQPDYHYDHVSMLGNDYRMRFCNRCDYPYDACVCGSDYYEQHRRNRR